MGDLNSLKAVTTKGNAFINTREVYLESARSSRLLPLDIPNVVTIVLPNAFRNVVEKTLISKLSPIR